jgi:hypothetical protein
MPLLTIAEAARRAGVDVSTLHRQIKKGVLSASKGPDGKRGIDPSELVRVYPDTAHAMAQTMAEGGQSQEPARVENWQAMAEHWQARVEELERDKRWLQGQMERLLPPPKRSFVDKVVELVSRLRRG